VIEELAEFRELLFACVPQFDRDIGERRHLALRSADLEETV